MIPGFQCSKILLNVWSGAAVTEARRKTVCFFLLPKETILERADFILQLLMFVTEEKEREMSIIFFFSSFCQLLSPGFKAGTG